MGELLLLERTCDITELLENKYMKWFHCYGILRYKRMLPIRTLISTYPETSVFWRPQLSNTAQPVGASCSQNPFLLNWAQMIQVSTFYSGLLRKLSHKVFHGQRGLGCVLTQKTCGKCWGSTKSVGFPCCRTSLLGIRYKWYTEHPSPRSLPALLCFKEIALTVLSELLGNVHRKVLL